MGLRRGHRMDIGTRLASDCASGHCELGVKRSLGTESVQLELGPRKMRTRQRPKKRAVVKLAVNRENVEAYRREAVQPLAVHHPFGCSALERSEYCLEASCRCPSQWPCRARRAKLLRPWLVLARCQCFEGRSSQVVHEDDAHRRQEGANGEQAVRNWHETPCACE